MWNETGTFRAEFSQKIRNRLRFKMRWNLFCFLNWYGMFRPFRTKQNGINNFATVLNSNPAIYLFIFVLIIWFLGAVFKYTAGAHNVLRVDGTGFQECKAADDIVPLTTGNDVIPLSTPGNKWLHLWCGQTLWAWEPESFHNSVASIGISCNITFSQPNWYLAIRSSRQHCF